MTTLAIFLRKSTRPLVIGMALSALIVMPIGPTQPRPVAAQEAAVVPFGEEVTITEMNYHAAWFEDDPNNQPPSGREAESTGNTAQVALTAYPGEAGVAQAYVGVDFEWDLGPYTWDEVKELPVEVGYPLDRRRQHRTGRAGDRQL